MVLCDPAKILRDPVTTLRDPAKTLRRDKRDVITDQHFLIIDVTDLAIILLLTFTIDVGLKACLLFLDR